MFVYSYEGPLMSAEPTTPRASAEQWREKAQACVFQETDFIRRIYSYETILENIAAALQTAHAQGVEGERERIETAVKARDYDAWRLVSAAIRGGEGMSVSKEWPGKLTRIQAIGLIDHITDRDDPYWEQTVADYYDEKTDTMPTIYHLMAALGITEAEYRKATGCDGKIKWPKP